MRHIIWRNRASAILGLLVVIIPFTGFPLALRDSLVVLFGALIVIFGFYRGSGNYALVEEETETINLQVSPEIEEGKVEIEGKVKRRRWGRSTKSSVETVEDLSPKDLSQ